MMTRSQSQIILQTLNYFLPDSRSILKDLSLSFCKQKTGIIGRNGIGKSTLLKLITGELQPSSGSVYLSGSIGYCPQNFVTFSNATVAEVLGVSEKIAALDRIEKGSVIVQDFELVGDDWNIRSQVLEQLKIFELSHIDLTRSLKSMSGGEVTRLWLAKLFFNKTDFLLLDEPTNNLDLSSRQLLYQAVSQWQKGLIVISHDRDLLNLMNRIIELNSLGAKIYGGNYQDYLEQKALEQSAAYRQLNDANKQINKTKKLVQQIREKHDQRQSKGREARKAGGQTKLILNSMKERSEQSAGDLSTKKGRLLKNAEQQLQEAKDKIEIVPQINIKLPNTAVSSNKVILAIEKLTFRYNSNSNTIIQNFDLVVKGPERIVLFGKNGCGKTTLVRLFQGSLQPESGDIYVGVPKLHYLDQHVNILNPELTILENYQQLNPDLKETDARFNLASFLFRNIDVLKKVCQLSRGEKLRVALSCILTSSHPPQLLILDEPTNHLDLDSIASLESALNCFKGALLVISHDQSFIKNIGLSRVIRM